MTAEPAPDRRINPWRADLAAAHLRGHVEAARFVEGETAHIAAARLGVHAAPSPSSQQISEALHGEAVTVYERKDGWAWGQLARDHYVGYVREEGLRAEGMQPTHHVAVPMTLKFAEPDIKCPNPEMLGLTVQLAVSGEIGAMSAVAGGYVPTAHLKPVDAHAQDFVAVAEGFVAAPYLWGGKSAHGLDCSGLVQLALHAAGRDCPRDTDMQARALGEAISPEGGLRRGDLVFWAGHVGIMVDVARMLHANAHHMATVIEDFSGVAARIAKSAGPVTAVRRI